jgi:hypothetical protein
LNDDVRIQQQGTEGKSEEETSKQKKATPYVVFVGQLPFRCTQEQLTEHFQQLELQAPPQVRYATVLLSFGLLAVADES